MSPNSSRNRQAALLFHCETLITVLVLTLVYYETMQKWIKKRLWGVDRVEQALERGRGDRALELLHEGVALCRERERLHRAAELGHLDLVRWLLSVGADPDRPNSYGELALHRAIACDHEEVASVLATYTSQLTSPDREGQPPLRRAREQGLEKLTKVLTHLLAA